MSWNYSQASGCITDPWGAIRGVGYSGQPPHKNLPSAESLEGLGPIPCGEWEMVSLIEHHPKLGPNVIVLRPDETTRARVLELGREPESFRVHGERNEPPEGYASDGCIIQNHDIRMLMWGFKEDRWIHVQP